MKYVAFSLSVIWQLPQNIAGCLIFLLHYKKAAKIEISDFRVYVYSLTSYTGFSLGNFIFLKKDIENYSYTVKGKSRSQSDLIKHETGHSIQSLILGPFFLITIGVLSLSWNIFYELFKLNKKDVDYYSFFTESWADELGGVKWIY